MAAVALLASSGAAVALVRHGSGPVLGLTSVGDRAGATSHRDSGRRGRHSRSGPSRSLPPTASDPATTGAPAPSASSSSTDPGPARTDAPSQSPTSPAQPTSGGPGPAPAGDGACVGGGNAPGAPDPWGGCWPGPQNTGYPHGVAGDGRPAVTLTAYTGRKEITSCGVVIDSKVVDGDLVISGGNGTHSPSTPCVTIKNSLVKGTIHTDSVSDGPVVISDTEVDASADAYWASIGFYNTFTYRVDSHGGQGTIKCQAYCESRDSWVHGMDLNLQYHYNAFGGNGIEAAGAAFVINHGYADCGGFDSRTSNVGGDAGCSADIGFYGDFAPVRNITITRTYFAPSRPGGQFGGSTQPGYCLNPGYYPGKPYPDPSNVVVTDNVFARGPNGRCGEYGAANTWLAGGGNVWSGNRYDDGTVIAAP